MTFDPFLVVLPFSTLSKERLEALANAVVLPEDRRSPGKSESRWLSYCAGRAALGWAFQMLGESHLKVASHPFWGYLSVRGRPDLFVNVSHTEKVAVAIVSSSPMGIDIERCDRDVSKVLRRAAIKDELAQLKSDDLSDKQSLKRAEPQQVGAVGGKVPAGVALWSAKEAVSKALGLGIKFGLHQFKISFEGPMPFEVITLLKGPLELRQPTVNLFCFENYVISVCGERSELERGISLRLFPLASF